MVDLMPAWAVIAVCYLITALGAGVIYTIE
jgi:hypothetical protein